MGDSINLAERCVLCLDPKRSPVSIRCGHSFCLGCLNIYRSHKEYPWANKCPICREVMQEQKGSMKRKNSGSNSRSTSSVSLTSTTPQRSNSVEEFMSLAANYLDDSRDENDIYFDSYEDMGHQSPDENFSMPYSQIEEENGYEDMVFTDTDDYNDHFDGDDDDSENDENNNQLYYYEDYGLASEPNAYSDNYYSENHEYDDYYSEHEHDSAEEASYTNTDNDDETYGIDSFDIDWETVIASDVITID